MTKVEDSNAHIHDTSGSDVIAVGANLTLLNAPVGIIKTDEGASLSNDASKHLLGLGDNSTLMSKLQSIGASSSRTWSLYQGLNGAEAVNQVDGALTIGGYDRAKISGPNITLPLRYESKCSTGLMISVDDIKMNLKNGSSPSVLGSSAGSAFKACITPGGAGLSLSEDIWSRFVTIAGSVEAGRSTGVVNYWNMLVQSQGAWVFAASQTIFCGLTLCSGTMAISRFQ